MKYFEPLLLLALFAQELVQGPVKPAPPMVAPTEPQVILAGKVSNVVDIDTVDVELKIIVRVRFDELDAVEKSTPLGAKGRDELKTLAEGQDCLVKFNLPKGEKHIGLGIWSYDRWIGRVWLSNSPTQSLGQWGIEHGYKK